MATVAANASAEEIVYRRQVNDDIREQIAQLESSIVKNEQIISVLDESAEWTELPDVEPTAPVEQPSPVPMLEPMPEQVAAEVPAAEIAAPE